MLNNLFKRAERPKLPDLGDAVRVVVISPEYLKENNYETIMLALGITPERNKELYQMAWDCMKPGSTFTSLPEAFVEVSKHCKHPNKLAMAVSMVTWMNERNSQQNLLLKVLGVK